MINQQLPGARLLISEVSPVIGVHAGPWFGGDQYRSGCQVIHRLENSPSHWALLTLVSVYVGNAKNHEH